METILSLLVLLVLSIPFFLYRAHQNGNRMKAALDDVQFPDGFEAGKKIRLFWFNGRKALGHVRITFNQDHSAVQIIYVKSSAPYTTVHVYQGAQIISAELKEDAQTISHTERSGGLGRAAVGALAFGGAGAIVGAATAGSRTTTETEVSSVAVHLLVDDVDAPLHKFETLLMRSKPSDKMYRDAIEAGEQLHSQFRIMIHRADQS